MYEAFFGLQRRPFAATPDPLCWYAGGPYQAALDELVVCAEQGQGIAVLISPAGSGKTILCERLSLELSTRFDTVLLRHATFQTRRALLQTLLSEMQQPFDKPTDQELRLGLAPVLRRLHQHGRALVLVVDEAHLLPESLLEELRILSDQAQEGKPLVRLILVGQAGLEEKLVHPAMQALNHRIRAQVVLSNLSRQETADYLDYRITWAGGRTDELFTPEAVDLICHAADGLPRCVNQLCDHVLLRAYSEEQRPATATQVAAALNDLKHLPLPWHAIPEPATDTRSMPRVDPVEIVTTEVESSFTLEFDDELSSHEEELPAEPSTPAMPVYRLSDHLDETDPESTETEILPTFAAATPAVWEAKPAASIPVPPAMTSGTEFVEELVIDRYTALDAGLTPPESPVTIVTSSSSDHVSSPIMSDQAPHDDIPRYSGEPLSWQSAMERLADAKEITERLEAVHDVLTAAQVGHGSLEFAPSSSETSSPREELAAACPIGDRTAEDALGATVLELCDEVQPTAESESTVFEFGSDLPAPPPSGPAPTAAAESRRYRNLFTLLRRKQQGRA